MLTWMLQRRWRRHQCRCPLMIPQMPSASGRRLLNEKLHCNSILQPRISLELCRDISDSAARSSPPLSTDEDQNGGHGNMFTVDGGTRKSALMKVLSSCHSFPDISINSNEGGWRQGAVFVFPALSPGTRALQDWTFGNRMQHQSVCKASQLTDEHTYPNPQLLPITCK